MAYPNDLVRTKDWGTEILYDTDLEGQFDLIIAWLMSFAHESTGHTHTGAENNAPQLPLTTSVTGTLPVGNGGTGATTQQAAMNALAGAVTANRLLRANGTNVVLAQADLTTDITGTLPIANGGTGQTTAQAAINALTAVSSATNEHVLTKDTSTGNAIFKEVTPSGLKLVSTTTVTASTTTGNISIDSSKMYVAFFYGQANPTGSNPYTFTPSSGSAINLTTGSNEYGYLQLNIMPYIGSLQVYWMTFLQDSLAPVTKYASTSTGLTYFSISRGSNWTGKVSLYEYVQ